MNMEVKPVLFILFGLLLKQSRSSQFTVVPVSDDLDERSEQFGPLFYPQYYNEKRSYIYPQYDVEKYALIPEHGNDEKRDQIRGPSINPNIELNDETHRVDYGGQQKLFYDLKPEDELTENAMKFSEIERRPKDEKEKPKDEKEKPKDEKEKPKDEKEKPRDKEQKPKEEHRKISEKEKEAISTGLIKLLYDWKLHKEHQTGSGSGETEGKSEEKIQEKNNRKANEEHLDIEGESRGVESENRDGKISELKHKESKKEKGGKSLKENEQFNSTFTDALEDTKQTGEDMEITKAEPAKENKEKEPDAESEDEGSGMVISEKDKTKGKINVLVNVNINQRSLRSKVSHARKRKQRYSGLDKKEEGSEDDNDHEDEEDDETIEEENRSNENRRKKNANSMATHNRTANMLNSNQITAAITSTHNSSQVHQQAHQQTYPVAWTQPIPQNNYVVPPYSQAYSYINQSKQVYPATNNVYAPNAMSDEEDSLDDEEDYSGDDPEYDMIEEKIEEEGSAIKPKEKEENRIRKAKPEKTTTTQNQQRQIYLPGTMMTVTETHEKKPGKQINESEKLSEDEEHSSVEQTEKETEDGNETNMKNDENRVTESIKKVKQRKYKSKQKYLKDGKQMKETYSQKNNFDEKSTATPKFSKPKNNPMKVTKNSDDSEKNDKPSVENNEQRIKKVDSVAMKTIDNYESKEENKNDQSKKTDDPKSEEESENEPNKMTEGLETKEGSRNVPIKTTDDVEPKERTKKKPRKKTDKNFESKEKSKNERIKLQEDFGSKEGNKDVRIKATQDFEPKEGIKNEPMEATEDFEPKEQSKKAPMKTTEDFGSKEGSKNEPMKTTEDFGSKEGSRKAPMKTTEDFGSKEGRKNEPIKTTEDFGSKEGSRKAPMKTTEDYESKEGSKNEPMKTTEDFGSKEGSRKAPMKTTEDYESKEGSKNEPMKTTEDFGSKEGSRKAPMKTTEDFGSKEGRKNEPIKTTEDFGSKEGSRKAPMKTTEDYESKEGSENAPTKINIGATNEDKPVPSNILEGQKEKEENVHLVNLQDTGVKILKEHNAKHQTSEPIVIDDIKKKHEKPKQNPKEATILNNNINKEVMKKEKQFPKFYESTPTTKRNFITVTPIKSKKVVPASKSKIKEKTATKGTKSQTKKLKVNEEGSGESESKKYGSLKSVRQRFKEWEKEMITKLSNPYLHEESARENEEISEGENEEISEGSGEERNATQAKTFKSWSDEENELISRLANPFLHANEKKKINKKKEEGREENIQSNKEVKSGNKTDIVAKEDATEKKEEAKQKDFEKKPVALNAVKANTTNLNQTTKGDKTNNPNKEQKEIKYYVPEEINKSTEKTSMERKLSDLKKLEKFKSQIITEVEKINKLQEEYQNNMIESKELQTAKNTLTKDLKYIKDIEGKMGSDLKGSKVKEKEENTENELKEVNDKNIANTEKQKNIKNKLIAVKDENNTMKEKESNTSKDKESNTTKDKESNTTKGKESNTTKDKEKTEVKKKGKQIKEGVIEKPMKKDNKKQDPLQKIQGLLQAEMVRTKNKRKKKNDKQLENIRNLLKQELKKLIISGKLGAPEKLPAKLRKLGKIISMKLKNARKKKKHNKKAKKSKKDKAKKSQKEKAKKSQKDKTALGKDLIKDWKPTVPGSARGHITTMSKYKAAMEALKSLKEQQQQAGPLVNGKIDNGTGPIINSTQSHESNSTNLHSGTPTKPHVVMPDNLPTGEQAEQFKNLLKNLNKKIGEVYTRLQTAKPGQQINSNHQMLPSNIPNNNTLQAQQQPQQSGFVTPQQFPTPKSFDYEMQQLQPIMPMKNSNSNPESKHEMPPEPEEKEESEPNTVLAETEPVETLIETLEKDITDVWSLKDVYPDAGSLGLDNDKIHRTYANLGSLSGLSLRRSLDRALRGKDVGLAIVGGSISKGGPFSEKGVDYALKTYFYVIADWWNKVIRPVTGSSMIIRDVSIGGIATDYYSYCLRTHLPDDKMTNIVLWELSANDMRRYDDKLEPKQQSLEQFTQEVLSYKAKPAVIFLNFFALFPWDQDLVTHCRNFEDEGEDDIAKHYKITSLSWRDMVCSLMQQNAPLFTRDELFSEDKFHPSIEGHAQMAYVVIDYIRTEFLKNLVKQRFLEIGDAVRKLKVPDSIYIPKPMYPRTFTWKPLCYTYMLVDNQLPNNTLSLEEQVNGNFHYSVLREFKVRSDKIIGMDTKTADQYITYNIQVPAHRNGDKSPYKSLAIMSFTDNREAEVSFDNSAPQKIETRKKFLEGTVLKFIAKNVVPGRHKLTVRSGPSGFFISAIMIG